MVPNIAGCFLKSIKKTLVQLNETGQLPLVSKLENYAVFRIDTSRLRGI